MLAVSSCPIAAGYVLQQSLQLASIFIVGRLGSVELSIVAFSYMIATGTGWLLAIGGTTAIGLHPYYVNHWKVDTTKR